MIRTRVGYAGGSIEGPTYHALGDHMEAVEIDFDPAKVSYQELLRIFFEDHDACSAPLRRQYASAIFVHGESQLEAARAAMKREGERRGRKPSTEILPAPRFWLAEDYHQKYYLKRIRDLARELHAIYPSPGDFVDSTAVARANAFVGGYGDGALLDRDLPRLGLSESGRRTLRELHARGH